VLARVIDQGLGVLSKPVDRRRISEMFRKHRHHGSHDFWPQGSRCVTI